ncbi:MAG: LemA family protein [Deltaproteobacteria bacterium]|nr:LemA family protein [Deltaproteobacteria bacterium]MBI3389571.1 LemA family protein [Deltaproteobacteria bacterium]
MRVRITRIGLAMLLAASVSGCGYNTMVSLKEQVDATWAQVENQLQRRNDLIPNLVETTKGYAGHEKEVFERIADARSKLIGAGSRSEKIDAAENLGSALSRLLVISEQYPQLKADAQFARLSDELAGTENRIATERRRYNDTVREYNIYIKKIPQVTFAHWFGFSEEKYFEAAKEAQQVPKVAF